MSSTTASKPTTVTTPVVVSLPSAALKLALLMIVALGVYYFIGVDEGLTSVFGKTMYIHEFVHDARHFLGFPCH